MGSMVQLYVRCDDQTAVVQLSRRFPDASIEPPSAFASVPMVSDEPMVPAELDRISKELGTEIIYLAFSSVTDSFQFTRSISGSTVRHLQYGMYVEQGLWEEVGGSAEEWEKPAFFTRDMPADELQDHPDRDRIAEIYAKGTVSGGEIYPMIDARESARAAAVHYRLTDWLDNWNDMEQRDASDVSKALQPAAPVTTAKPWWRFW
jgi:hypothetical protein